MTKLVLTTLHGTTAGLQALSKMTANKLLDSLIRITSIVLLPIQIIVQVVLLIAIKLTFGLLLLPLSLLWAVVLLPMVGISWLCNRVPSLREPLGILFIPWAYVAHVFAAFVPSMGDPEDRNSRVIKLMWAGAWPYTWEFWLAVNGKLESAGYPAIEMEDVVERMARVDPLMQSIYADIRKRNFT